MRLEKEINCSILISTYNWHQALNFCLQSLLLQTTMPNEILIADDGSNNETKILIEKFRQISAVPIIHVWQEDVGFRKCAVLNKAIAIASNEYIIQIDGDVILHPKFIYDHLRIARESYFVVGSRGALTESFSKKIFEYKDLPSFNILRKHTKGIFNTFRSKFISNCLLNRYKVGGRYKYYAKGCNMAFWKSDIIAVNGYNEELTGWGHEDEELVVRFCNYGLKKQFLKLGGVIFHIWHKSSSRQNENAHFDLVNQAKENKYFRCQKGVDQYL